ncbi:MAG: M15 family metallopeptidase [Firmicutes bacterium]|nr:M15 family metallopeptidase [Bacillota bacterium]
MNYEMLVNKNSPVSAEEIAKVNLAHTVDVYGNPVRLEVETLKAFRLLKTAMLENGIMIGLSSGFRSLERQQELIDGLLAQFSEEYVASALAPVGASEHHTGLALDFVVRRDGKWIDGNADVLYTADDIYRQVHPHLAEFGFILRYPLGKEHITEYKYEPWHIRYVGQTLAAHLYETNQTMEEHYIHPAPNGAPLL